MYPLEVLSKKQDHGILAKILPAPLGFQTNSPMAKKKILNK